MWKIRVGREIWGENGWEKGGFWGWGKEENMGEEWEKSVRWGCEERERNRMEGRGRCVDWVLGCR